MTTQPFATISIVSHGDDGKIERLLASLQKHEPQISSFQLILTDNLGNDLSDFDPSPWASLHIVRNERPLGFARNHNRAFEIARGKYFSILNPDLIFEQPVFDGLISRLQRHRAGLIAPLIIDENGMVQDSFRALPTPFDLVRRRLPGYKFEQLEPDSEGMIEPEWIAGMFWLMESELYRQMGGMDERYRLYFEDVDFCTRARLRGIRFLVDGQARVRHDAQRSSRKNIRYLILHLQSALRFFRSPVYRQTKQRH